MGVQWYSKNLTHYSKADTMGKRRYSSYSFLTLMVQYISYLHISRKPMIHLGGKYYRVFSMSFEYPGN
jgi:uncharacterized LabA/DUF88 family protein